MAVGTILTVLSNIPWGAVVENAPKVAEGAEKLWKTVTRWKKSDPVQNGQIDMLPKQSMSETELLSARLMTVEESVRQLNEQMQGSSELLKALAEQNTVLVQRIELNRIRLIRFAVIAGGAGVVLLGFNAYLLFFR